MKLYKVTYRTSDWASDDKTVHVVAGSILKAIQRVQTQKYLNYSGYIRNCERVMDNLVVVK